MQFRKSYFQTLGDISLYNSPHWYQNQLCVPHVFQLPENVWYLSIFSFSFMFCAWSGGSVTYSRLLWPTGLDWEISLYIKLTEISMSHSLRRILVCAYTIWAHIQNSVSCTVDHLSHLVVHSLILFCTGVVYYLINGFISDSTKPAFAMLLRIIYFCLDVIDP